MPHLAGLILTHDATFKSEVAALLRSGPIPASLIDEAAAQHSAPDIVVIDARHDTPAAMAAVARTRTSMPVAGIFVVARTAETDAILEAMRAGANEFLTWPAQTGVVHEAIRRALARRDAAPGARAGGTTLVFFGAKGGTGTTTLAVNSAVSLARANKPSLVLDLRAGVGEAGLFLGVRPKYTLLDAIDNLHRLDNEFLRELVVKHKSGVEVLAGSDDFERPGAADASAIEEVVRFLSKEYEQVVIDAGSHVTPCSVAALYAADEIVLVATPDVPSTRNAQRLIEHFRQLGISPERLRFVLNRANEPLPIPQKHIESAIGYPVFHMFPSDYKTVSAAVNAGVPLAGSGGTDVANQFEPFARRLMTGDAEPAQSGSKPPSRLSRVASLW